MHWISMKDRLPIEYPFSMKGFATIKEPGSPARMMHGVFHSGRDVYRWEKHPEPWMVKSKFHWESHLPISKYDVVFCEETSRDKDGTHYYVYPQPWIVAWMPEPMPYMEDDLETFEVELDGLKYYVDTPDFEPTSETTDIYDSYKFWNKTCKERFIETFNHGKDNNVRY